MAELAVSGISTELVGRRAASVRCSPTTIRKPGARSVPAAGTGCFHGSHGRPAPPICRKTGRLSSLAARCGSANGNWAPGTVSGSSRWDALSARSTSPRLPEGPFRMPTLATGSIKRRQDAAMCRRLACCCSALRSRRSGSTDFRSRSSRGTARAAGSLRSSGCAGRGNRPSLPRDRRTMGGPRPLCRDSRGMGRTPRSVPTSLAGRVGEPVARLVSSTGCGFVPSRVQGWRYGPSSGLAG